MCIPVALVIHHAMRTHRIVFSSVACPAVIMRFVIPVVLYAITNVESDVYWTVHHCDN